MADDLTYVGGDDADETERLVLGDLLNRVLDKGVVISGHVTVSIADIELLAVDLRLLLSSVQTMMEHRTWTTNDAPAPVLPPSDGR